MTRFLIVLTTAILGLGASAYAAATDIQIGNVAPASGDVQLYVDGVRFGPTLAYLAFAKIARNDGPLRVEAVAGGDRLLAAATLDLQADPRIQPMLVLVGNGSEQPYSIRLYQRVGLAETKDANSSSRAKSIENAAVAAHHLAPYAESTGDASLINVLSCLGVSPNSSSAASTSLSRNPGFGAVVAHPHSSLQEINTCRFTATHPIMGGFDVTVPMTSHRTVRFILVGDGNNSPFRLVVAQDGVVLQIVEPSTPMPAALIRSDDVWFDLSRPAQSITLYEIPGGPDVFGFWFTHNADGTPTWFFFDGVATDLPGQRDLTMHRGTGSDENPTVLVGSARLFYLDCNNAELRVLSGEREFHTLRLRRSREVDACDALE